MLAELWQIIFDYWSVLILQAETRFLLSCNELSCIEIIAWVSGILGIHFGEVKISFLKMGLDDVYGLWCGTILHALVGACLITYSSLVPWVTSLHSQALLI